MPKRKSRSIKKSNKRSSNYIRRSKSPRLSRKKCRDIFGSATKKQCTARRSRCTWNKNIGCVKLSRGKRSRALKSKSKSKSHKRKRSSKRTPKTRSFYYTKFSTSQSLNQSQTIESKQNTQQLLKSIDRSLAQSKFRRSMSSNTSDLDDIRKKLEDEFENESEDEISSQPKSTETTKIGNQRVRFQSLSSTSNSEVPPALSFEDLEVPLTPLGKQ